MTAYILIQASPQGRSPRIAQLVAAIPGVDRVHQVTGPYDLVVEVGSDGVGDSLVERIAGLDGVLHVLRAPVATAVDAA